MEASFCQNHRHLLGLYQRSRECANEIERDAILLSMREFRRVVDQSGCDASVDAFNRYLVLIGLRLRLPDIRDKIDALGAIELLGPLRGGGKPGISIVTCAMNRTENLLQVIPSWLCNSNIREVVIVDWSSRKPVRQSLAEAGVNDARIKIVRVEDELRWILSYAFNVGFRSASYSMIMKIDTDIQLKDHFFEVNQLNASDTFIAGNWRTAEKGQEHINGFLFASRDALARVGGFNEYIKCYGWDDDDLYSRLLQAGYSRKDVAPETIYHIPHSDEERTGQKPPVDGTTLRESIMATPRYLIHRNRNVCALMPKWGPELPGVPMGVIKRHDDGFTLRRIDGNHASVPADIVEMAAQTTFRELMSWDHGGRINKLSNEAITALLERKAPALTKLDIEVGLIDPRHLPKPHERYLVLVVSSNSFDHPVPGNFSDLDALAERLLQLASRHGLRCIIYSADSSTKNTPRALHDLLWLSNPSVLEDLSPVNIEALAQGEIRSNASLELSRHVFSQINLSSPQVYLTKPKLFIDAQHGLGNRLRAIGSAAAIARATDRELIIVWQPDDHCNCRFADLFDYGGAVLDASFIDDAADCDVHNYMPIEGGEKNAPIRTGADRNIYVRSAFVLNSPHSGWNADNSFIQALRPIEAVQALVNSVRHPNDVSAHVRMEGGRKDQHLPYESTANWTEEDHDLIDHWRSKSHFKRFMVRIDQLIAEGKSDRIFIAADKPETYQEFYRVYGDRIAWLKRSLYDRSKGQLQYALADAILLSRAPLLLGSTWSSFSELAQRLANVKMSVEMSGKDF
jgi:hypothetical protein